MVPLGGSLIWHRRSNEPVFANSKTILHVISNDDYRVSHPAGEELSAVFWPTKGFVTELTGVDVGESNPPVQSVCTGDIQLSLRRLIAMAPASVDELAFEETMVDVMGKIYSQIDRERSVSAKSMRAIIRAKEYIHTYFEDRLSLSEIADAAGVSPVYLTQLFSMSEGTPLYRYHLDLRLDAALNRLPHCEDITRLALDLGFSSHSHFSSEFSRRFGVSPSAHRQAIRNQASDRNIVGNKRESGFPGAVLDVVPLCEARGGRKHLLAA